MPEISDDELTALRARAETGDAAAAALTQAQTDAQNARTTLQDGVARYRETIRAANPAIPPDAITGDDFAAIDSAVTTARNIFDAGQSAAAAARPAAPSVPAGGAPTRHDPPDTTGLSPAAKIRLGLTQRDAANKR